MLVSVKCESRLISKGRLLLAATCLAIAGSCSDSASAPLQPNLLLITVDTLRADHLGAWGDTQVDTPALDAFAAQSFVFDQAYTAIPITTPSLGSMLTGVLPRHHGALNNSDDISLDLETLPMALRDLGYETGAFLPTFLADKPGFKRGFDVYDFPALGTVARPGSEVVSLALAWLEERAGDEPWFAWVHLVDPHAPYDPGPELESKYLPVGVTDFPARLREEVFLQGLAPSQDELQVVRALYRGEVELTDRALRPLLEFTHEGRELVTLFTADHGEMLGEKHGYIGHTGYLNDEMLRVPFLVHFSSGDYEGNRSYFPAYSLDVAPTLHALAHGSGELDGSSYEGGLPLFDPAVIGTLAGQDRMTLGSRFLVHETFAPEGFFDQSAARSAPYKVLLDAGKERRGGLFFMDEDAAELTDQSGAQESWSAEQKVRVEMLARSFRDWHKRHDPVQRADGTSVDAAFQEALAGMGYFGAGAGGDEKEAE